MNHISSRRGCAGGLALALLLATSPVLAQSVAIANPGFESPALNLCNWGVAPTSWTPTADAGVWHCGTFGQCFNSYRLGPPAGQQIAYINSGTLSQTLAATLTANTQYTLRIKVGRRADCCTPSGPDYAVQLRTAAGVLNEDLGSLVLTGGAFRTTTIRFGVGSAHPQLGQPLQIRLLTASSGQSNFDEVELLAVPADCNNNGVFDAIDIGNGAPDVNGNGVPDACETGQCVPDIAPAIIGDGTVNIDDLLAVIGQWGTCSGCPADIAPAHGNGSVTIDDLLAVIGAWGPCPLGP